MAAKVKHPIDSTPGGCNEVGVGFCFKNTLLIWTSWKGNNLLQAKLPPSFEEDVTLLKKDESIISPNKNL